MRPGHPGTPCTPEALKALWMAQTFAGPSERFDHEQAFEELMHRLVMDERERAMRAEQALGGLSNALRTLKARVTHLEALVPHNAVEPVPRPKMDTPTGMFAGACSCGWVSSGLRSRSEAMRDAEQHVTAKRDAAGR